MKELSFLNECCSTTAEKTWTNFHSAILNYSKSHDNDILTTWVCLRVFKRILNHHPSQSTNQTSVLKSFGPADMEIVAYIGGSVVQKLRKQASRLSDENKQKQVVALFFKIRAHNKARKVMQRKVDQKKVLLKEKSLRKRLKKNLPTT
jgi:hypothetical protein